MAVKVTSPLFFSSIKGTVSGIGTFRDIGGGSVLTHKKYGSKGNRNATEEIKNCFKAAKEAHSEIPPTYSCVAGTCKNRIFPKWPDYWLQYLEDNQGCVP